MNARTRIFVLAALLAMIAVAAAPLPSFAALPDWRDPNSIMSWLRLQAIAVSFVVTLLWKHVPGVRNLSNAAAPWLALIVFLVDALRGSGGGFGLVSVAHAASSVPVAVPLHWSARFAIAVLNCAIAKPLWDGWIKPTVGHKVDRWLGREPQTPDQHRALPV